MADRPTTQYDRRANEYEDKARRVTDPWVKQRYLVLAERCREMQTVPKSEETGFSTDRIASFARQRRRKST
jgi:hypothetical protein